MKPTFHILTLFPEMFSGPFGESILKRAQEKGLVKINLHNLRDYAEDKHKTVDDTPYGGGPGMVLKIDVMDKAITSIKSKIQMPTLDYHSGCPEPAEWANDKLSKTILMTPQGKTFNQAKARELSGLSDIILICGHYEGFDERVREHLVDEEISLGDFVLSGGEIPAMAVVDAVSRLIPGVLGHDESSEEESFGLKDEKGNLLLEYPIYTRPAEHKGWRVPEILQSGNHAAIKKWRLDQAKKRTKAKHSY